MIPFFITIIELEGKKIVREPMEHKRISLERLRTEYLVSHSDNLFELLFIPKVPYVVDTYIVSIAQAWKASPEREKNRNGGNSEECRG